MADTREYTRYVFEKLIWIVIGMIITIIFYHPISNSWSKIKGDAPKITMYLSSNDYVANNNGFKNISDFIKTVQLDSGEIVEGIIVNDNFFIITDNLIAYNDFIGPNNHRKCHAYTFDSWEDINLNWLKFKLLFLRKDFSVKTISPFEPPYPVNCSNCHLYSVEVINEADSVGENFRARLCFDTDKVTLKNVTGDFVPYEVNCIYATRDHFTSLDKMKGNLIMEFKNSDIIPSEVLSSKSVWLDGKPLPEGNILETTNILISNCTTNFFEKPHYIIK